MLAKSISILGLRGFSQEKTMNLAIPNGKVGSGITVLVGPNNSGKSTVFEAFKILSIDKRLTPGLSEEKRNKTQNEKVIIELTNLDDSRLTLTNEPELGSTTSLIGEQKNKIFTSPSRRHFPHEFSKDEKTREGVLRYSQMPALRGQGISEFTARMFHAEKNKERFNEIFFYLLGKEVDWKIDMRTSGQHYIKILPDGLNSHNTEGLGEGILSMFTIADILYESEPNDIIYIDEPELSIHPALQRRLMEVLMEISKDRQIVLNTHSPYFINWESIINGGEIVRCVKESDGINIYQLSEAAKNSIIGITNDSHFPHALGNEAKEVFFLEDDVILLEGQEDVIFYKIVEDKLGIPLNGNYFGWGVGGATKMEVFCKILQDLGYKKVFGILDGDKLEVLENLKQKFGESGYNFEAIPADDIRYKPARKSTEKVGVVRDGEIIDEYIEPMKNLFTDINKFFSPENEE